MDLHRLLARQVKRHLGDLSSLTPELRAFVEVVSAAYQEGDQDRIMLERTLELSSQELLQANSEMRAVFQSVPDLLLRLDSVGRVISTKSGLGGTLHFPSGDLVGKSVDALVPGQAAEVYRAAIAEVAARRVLLTTEYEISKAGAVEHFEARWVPLLADQIVVTVRNISDRKRDQETLRLAKEQAEQANTLKSQFLANMSHELRTPLNAIIGYSEMLAEDAEGSGREDLVPDLDRIHAAGSHLLALINDILDLSKIEAGRMELYLEPFDVASLVAEVVSTAEPLLAKKGNTFVKRFLGEPGTARADITKVRQILFNLLSNASKFTDGGQVELEVELLTAGGRSFIEYRVRDSGIGMTQEQLDRLFQPFVQADASTTRKYGGTGLGLVISRRFANMMGGDITVDSAPGSGSRFTVRLPLAVADGAGSEAPAISPALAAPPTSAEGPGGPDLVLVVDDDPAARDLLTRLVTREGFHVATAASGEECLLKARQLRPSLITLDVLMPGMDGWAVLTRLKSDPEVADIPVAMMTTIHNQGLGYALGASDYLTKPVERSRLASVLRKYHCPPCHAMVVEDDENTRDLLTGLLEREGWQVSSAENGRAALDLCRSGAPQLVLLDLLMPEMDGFQFVEEFRKVDSYRAIPIVVLTALTLGAEDYRRLAGGVERVLQKGAQPLEDVGSYLRGLLSHRGDRIASAAPRPSIG